MIYCCQLPEAAYIKDECFITVGQWRRIVHSSKYGWLKQTDLFPHLAAMRTYHHHQRTMEPMECSAAHRHSCPTCPRRRRAWCGCSISSINWAFGLNIKHASRVAEHIYIHIKPKQSKLPETRHLYFILTLRNRQGMAITYDLASIGLMLFDVQY